MAESFDGASCPGVPTTKEQLAACIDHTVLNPLATKTAIERHCREAVAYGFHAVCVPPQWTAAAADLLRDQPVEVVGLAGFPSGEDSPAIKARQAREAIMAGADEIDMVTDVSAIMEADVERLAGDMKAVYRECHRMRPPVLLKVIIESAALTDEQILFACRTAEQVGIDFVKTSTGLRPEGGATAEAVKLMAESAPNCRIKAAGGIRTAQQALQMLAAGASRIGTSASVQIMENFDNEVGPS
ncbi:MAG: deoxyribose-phosphate aldolase [Phycisphaerae bacterium]|nr:deoxyribose-phosphate aldolase [Phycisphaerae bacterium]